MSTPPHTPPPATTVEPSSTTAAYYGNVNRDLLRHAPVNACRSIEVGCGTGALTAALRRRNPQLHCTGVELHGQAARQAAQVLDELIEGDIETPAIWDEIDRRRAGQLYDLVVLGDVLEHLRDPWTVLRQLRERCTQGATCVVCLPNVAHWSVVLQQLHGHWDYVDAGLLDRTHLRFFTRRTAIEMLQQAGWTVADTAARAFDPENTERVVNALLPAAAQLGIPENNLRSDLSTAQWVLRAVNGPVPERLVVAGLGLRKVAGVTEARIDFPLRSLASLPGVKISIGYGQLSLPAEPGVLVLHRNFLDNPAMVDLLERQIRKGWVLVTDMDDDPDRWPQFAAAGLRAFRGVHAVTVSTPALAERIRAWNPEVTVFDNAIDELPVRTTPPAEATQPVRVFFGALNRQDDWGAIRDGLLAAAAALGDAVEFVVVHDEAFHRMLPAGVRSRFHPTLPVDQYMAQLASCDVALLPLADTPFNRLKSDLKFIECCAAGVVPLCSPVVYADRPEHHDIGLFATSATQWRDGLLRLCRDAPLRAERRGRGLAYVRTQRMHAQQLGRRLDFYRQLIASRAALESRRLARLAQG